MPKNYQMSFELNGEIDPRLKRAFSDLGSDVLDLKKDLNSLRKGGSFDEITRDAGRASGAFGELKEDVREFGQVFERTLQFTGAYAIIDKLTDSIGGMITTIGDLDAQSGQLGAATGATAEELAELQEISQSMYREGLGEGVNDLTDALITARNVTKQQGDELAQTTRNAIVLQDVFRFDIPESVKTSDTLMRQFGITSEQSMNLLAQGAQQGLDKSGELLDSANEYAPQFAALGYSANEMFDVFSAGLEAGAFNLDKVGDAVKEFNIRLQDGSEKTSDAMAALFAPEGIEDFTAALTKGGTKSAQYLELLKHVSADTAKEMVKDLQKGGKSAEDTLTTLSGRLGEGFGILDQLRSGAIKGKDAMQRVITELNTIEDTVYRNQLGVELFGSQWEDLEKDVVGALGSTNKQFDMTKQTMEEMAAVKYDNLTQELKVLGRELMDEVIIPIGEDLMPVLKDMTAWAKDNKDVIKAIGLAVPAAMLAKNTVGIAKDLGQVGKAVFDTTKGVGKFGGVLGLLSNPIGIAVGAVGALTAGVIAYKNHQEEARQELLNMGDDLEHVFDNYEDIEHQTKRTRNLIREYDRLEEKINDTATPAAILAEARRKQKIVEEELIALNPEILKAEDAKKESFRDQLDLANRLNTTELEREKRKIDAEILDKKSQLPELKENYDELTSNLSGFEQAYEDARRSYVQYQEFLTAQQKIIDTTTGEEQARKLSELADRIEVATGRYYGNNWANLAFETQDLKKAFESNLISFENTEKDIANAKDSFQELYDKQVALINLNLGAPIDELMGKYGELSATEKQRVDAAKEQIMELNQMMADMPLEKTINIGVHWKQYGDVAGPRLGMQSMQMYAEGGLANKPSIFGEAGPEMAIPIRKDQRSRDLHALTGKMIGVDQSDSGGGQFIYSPSIVIQGNADEQTVRRVIGDAQKEWESHLGAYQRNRQRVSMTQ
ncbi:phage tail tape measure protein [Paenibacillus sp. F411]|uniref:phage tail tape measure protein n=1 Tax=Paenibacillus sp. F411 TaxID=2820239 RepID=UPI001AAFA5DC|nr:phage tail tape measure protein [Paenibacillus sp. F411]MBO2943584.1 phage tail tape measure protein [Paenibacillus sp. F411]